MIKLFSGFGSFHPLANIFPHFIPGDLQRDGKLTMQQLLRQLHIAVIQLADTAARSGGLLLFVVHRFDDLDEMTVLWVPNMLR